MAKGSKCALFKYKNNLLCLFAESDAVSGYCSEYLMTRQTFRICYVTPSIDKVGWANELHVKGCLGFGTEHANKFNSVDSL